MTKKERWLESLSLKVLNGELDGYSYDSLDECFKTYSNAKWRAENWCKETFTSNVDDFIKQCNRNEIKVESNKYRHIVLSYNCNFFTYYQAFSFYTANDTLVVLWRYDTYANIKDGLFIKDRLGSITRFETIKALLDSLKIINKK